jgi:hypothetical protein
MKGKAMKMTKNASGRLAVATLLSFGLSAGIMGVASASSNRHHDGHDSSWTLGGSVQGVVTGYVAGSSIAIEAQGSTTSTTYALTSATTVTGLATGASLLNSKVVLLLSTTTPVTVLSIKVETPKSPCIQGVVTGYVAGSSIAIEAQGSTTSTTYALTSATTVTGLATGASLLNSKVVLLLSTTTPVTVLSIKVETPKSPCIQGVVTGYVAGSSIAIEAQGSTTSTTYALTSATTVTGLATGASLLNSKVVLLLSTTTPVTVLSIKVETNDSKCHGDNDQSKHDDGHSSSHGFSSHGHHGGHSSSQGNFRK